MVRSTITKIWLVSLGGLLAGMLVVAGGIVLLALSGGGPAWGGPQGRDLVGFTPGALVWPALAGAAAGSAVTGVAALFQLSSWVLALVETARVRAWAWFATLLALGALGFGLVGMAAYAVAGPGDDPRGPVPAGTGPDGPVGAAGGLRASTPEVISR